MQMLVLDFAATASPNLFRKIREHLSIIINLCIKDVIAFLFGMTLKNLMVINGNTDYKIRITLRNSVYIRRCCSSRRFAVHFLHVVQVPVLQLNRSRG